MAVKAVRSMSVSGELYHSPGISWSADNRIALAIDDGIHIMEPILHGTDPTPFSCRRSFIPNSTNPLEFNVGCDRESLINNSENRDMTTEMMLDRTLCPDAAYSAKSRCFKSAIWSPASPSRPYRNVLASLSVDHRLILSQQDVNKWFTIVDLSNTYYESNAQNGFAAVDAIISENSDTSNSMLEYQSYKTRMYYLSAVEIVWSQCFTHEDQDIAFLFVAMKSGHIVIWKVNMPCFSEEDISIDSVFDTGMGNITCLTWQETSKNNGLIVIGSQSGMIQMLYFNVTENKLTYGDPAMLWDDEDLVPVKCIAIGWQQSGNYVIVCGKSHYIVSTLISSKGELMRQAVSEGIHSLPLTNICSLINGWFLASSLDFNIYKFQVDTLGEDITLMEEIVVFDVPTNKILPYGIIQSPNAVFCCLVQRIACLYDHLSYREPIKIHFFVNQEEDVIWSNLISCKRPFSQCKDIQEFIRIRLNFENALPKMMTDILNSDSQSLMNQSSFVLKLCRYIFSKQLAQVSPEDYSEKKSRLKMVSDIILMKHILKTLKVARTTYDLTELSVVKLKSLLLASGWLLGDSFTFSLDEEEKQLAEDTFSQIKYELPQSEHEEICCICQETIPFSLVESGSCCNGHNFGRCCHTLLVCDSYDYKKCTGCDSLMRLNDVWTDGVCTYCDELIT